MDAALTHEKALDNALELCQKLGIRAQRKETRGTDREEEIVLLEMQIGERTIAGSDVPEFLARSLTALYEQELLTDDDIPYKSGRVRYLISETPRHDHGRDFIRPVPIELGGNPYFFGANISRNGAMELMQRLLGSRATSAT